MLVAFYLAGEITQVKESIPWVRCASGNVLIQELKLAVKYLSKKYGLKDVSWIFKTIWAGKQSKNRQVNQFILIVCHCLVQMLKSLAFINLFQTKIWEKLMKKVSLAIILINIANLHVHCTCLVLIFLCKMHQTCVNLAGGRWRWKTELQGV